MAVEPPDDLGAIVVLQRPMRRIVSLVPSLTADALLSGQLAPFRTLEGD